MGVRHYIKNWLWHDRETELAIRLMDGKLDALQYSILGERVQWRMDYLRDKTLHSSEEGVCVEHWCSNEIVVSLTSFGRRIYDVHLAIESIMQGTLKPNRIILWLSEAEFRGKVLPITLQRQQLRGLEVRFCEDLRSYTKLIHALKQFPESCIITIDDDCMYEYDIVERLVNTHVENPNSVCACRIHKVRLDENGMPVSYLQWEKEAADCQSGSPLLFPTGVGGVLYPPHCFPDEVFNKEVFMSICPYADDVWFYAMELLNGTPVVQTYTGVPCYYLNLQSSTIEALSELNTNEGDCRNDDQMKAVFERYGLVSKLKNIEFG